MITMSDTDYSDDKKVRKINSDIEKFRIELQKSESELSGIGARLDGEIDRLRTDAKSRRDAYEAIRSRVREAEDAWKTANAQNTVSSFAEYLKMYPNGAYSIVAKQSVKAIVRKTALKNAGSEEKEIKNGENFPIDSFSFLDIVFQPSPKELSLQAKPL